MLKYALNLEAVNEAGNNGDMIPNDFAGNPTSRVFRTFSAFGLVFTGQLHYFPLTSVYTKTGSPFWFQFTFSPESTQLTTLRCDVYSAKYSGSVDFEGIIKDNLQSLVTSKIQQYERVYAKLTGSENHPSDGSCM